jgi:hypothetical protein
MQRTRGHPFDDFGPGLRSACLERLRWDCERRGYTVETVPRQLKASLVGKIRCHALHHYSAAYMRHLAAKRSGYAAQRKFQDEIAEGKRQEHPIRAARRIAGYVRQGQIRQREEAERRAKLGLPPKPRSNYTYYDDPWPGHDLG